MNNAALLKDVVEMLKKMVYHRLQDPQFVSYAKDLTSIPLWHFDRLLVEKKTKRKASSGKEDLFLLLLL
ncbi:hypothetical protein CEXT_133231 [Caerostris extrusa]|uniref:Uncharacterized protein n=1 Tax=Caerostris extrusa TaxID=172846 RepID=A0AAV4UTQ9_CAEEX|nr:hypothetical protein CEXT_133231 [Caerostris extrusa]